MSDEPIYSALTGKPLPTTCGGCTGGLTPIPWNNAAFSNPCDFYNAGWSAQDILNSWIYNDPLGLSAGLANNIAEHGNQGQYLCSAAVAVEGLCSCIDTNTNITPLPCSEGQEQFVENDWFFEGYFCGVMN